MNVVGSWKRGEPLGDPDDQRRLLRPGGTTPAASATRGRRDRRGRAHVDGRHGARHRPAGRAGYTDERGNRVDWRLDSTSMASTWSSRSWMATIHAAQTAAPLLASAMSMGARSRNRRLLGPSPSRSTSPRPRPGRAAPATTAARPATWHVAARTSTERTELTET